jgi:hypothetical protein
MVVDILILCYDLIGSDNMIVERDYLAGPSGGRFPLFMVHASWFMWRSELAVAEMEKGRTEITR